MNVIVAILLLFVGLPVLTTVLAVAGRRARAFLGALAAVGGGTLLAAGRFAPAGPGAGGWLLLGLAFLLLVPQLRSGSRPRLALPARAGGRPRRMRIDPSAVGGIWSALLRDAVAARDQFVAVGRRAPAGAIRDQLNDLRADVDHALGQAWDRARRGWELEGAAAGVAAAASAQRPRARWGRGWFVGPEWHDPRVREAQRSRDQAAARLAAALAEERAQLQVLVARLGEAACSAAELSAAGQGVLAPVPGTDRSRELVDRLSSLRAALTEASAA